MIEVEKKFVVSQDELTRLVAGAHLLGKEVHTDVYYDSADHALTKKDIWLRSRSGRFELKFPVGVVNDAQRVIAHDEIENDAGICAKLGIPADVPLAQSLVSLGYFPFATVTTTRLKYEREGFHIDVDRADFGYDILEIELMVPSESDVKEAYQKILDFATAHGIPIPEKRTRGKVLEYIRRSDPAHFHALEEAWGVTF